MKFEIKSRINGSILFSIETETLKLAVEAAVKAGADLTGACLAGACLAGADLAGADLIRADLTGAYLTGACLAGACLAGADLTGACLTRAYLAGADLAGACLAGADLAGAEGLKFFPVQISGHKHWLSTTTEGTLRIGCHVYTFEDWRKHTDAIGRKEGYSPLDVEIYKLHIEHIERISKLLWNAKEEKAVAGK